MSPLRVLMGSSSLEAGGSERQMIGLLKRLDRERFAPHLYLLYRSGPLLAEVPDDVPVHAYWDDAAPPRWNWPGRILSRQRRDLRHMVQQWEIDCIYDRMFHTTLVTAGSRAPRVSTIVNDPSRMLATEARFVGWKRAALRRAYRSAARVVAVSEGVRRAAIEFYQLPPDHVLTIHSPVDLDRIDALAAEPPAVALPPNRRHVVAIGRLQHEKGFDLLIEAAGTLVAAGAAPFSVHILGEGPARESLRTLIDDRGLDDVVFLEGFLSNPYAVLQAADLFCLCSRFEGLPNVLLEALACRVPVVATDCPSGPREILDDGRLGGLVAADDAGALAAAIGDVLRDLAPARARTDAGRERIEADFSPTAGVRRLELLLEECANRRA